MKEFFTYDAFISYRHADLDKYVAETLHKKLEAFKLPHSASRNRLEGEKTRIKRIFRDKDELPIASDLASPIMTALNESEFLIVICSPRTPESIWVKREIETFISLHGRDHVLAVLIEGEPSESFPPALLTARKEVTLEDGTKALQKIAVEPLAADVRGKTRHEVKRNIRRELLRLAAPMFDCSYDDLKQRHRQRRLRRILVGALLINLFLICFGSFSTIQALRISRQAEQIQQQSEEIQKQSDRIHEQYQNILVSSLNTLADTALRLLDEGDRMKSILVAETALPTSSNDQETPLVSHAEYALASSLYVYENESELLPDRALDHDTDVQFMMPSPSGERLLTVDSTNIATIWNTVVGEPIATFITAKDNLYRPDEDSFAFVSENEVVFYADNTIKRYNYETGEMLWETDETYIYNYVFSPDKTLMAVSDHGEICVYDLADGTVKTTWKAPSSDELSTIGQTMTFSNDSQLLAFTAQDIRSEGSGLVQILQLSSASITQTLTTEYPYICSLLFTDDWHLAIAANSYADLTTDLFMTNHSGDVLLYDLRSSENTWDKHFVGQTIYSLTLSLTDQPFLIATSYDTVNSLTLGNGSLMGSINFSSAIIDAVSYNNNTYGYCVTRDGNVQSINYDGGIIYNIYFETCSSNIKSSVKASNYVAVLSHASRQVILYRFVENAHMEPLMELDDNTSDIGVSQDGKYCFVTTSTNQNALIGYDYATNKELFRHEFDQMISHAFYAGKDDQYIVLFFTTNMEIYDSHTGEPVKTIAFADCGYVNSYCYRPETGKLYTAQEHGLCTYDLFALSEDAVIESELFTAQTASAAATYDGTTFILSNKQTGQLEEYTADQLESPMKSIAINTNYVTSLFYSSDGSQLFVVYQNRQVEVYQAENLTLLHTYHDLNNSSTRYIPLGNPEGDYILANDYQGYLFTKEHEVKACFPHFRCLDSTNQKILVHSYRRLFAIPVYDLDMLLTEAERQLNGRTLTEEEKKDLYIQ